MEKKIVIFFCILTFFLGIFFVGLTDNYFKYNYFDLGEKFLLTGDYSKSNTIDMEKQFFISLYKMICDEKGKNCVVVIEIDYEKLAGYLKSEGLKCGINIENIGNDVTDEQKQCLADVIQQLGLLK